MSPKSKRQLALEHLETARRELDQGVEVAALTFLHLAAEAAIVAIADAEGIETFRRHDKKAEAAAELHRRGLLQEDISGVLQLLNQARKDATYEGEDPDLAGESLTDLAERIERVVSTAQELGR